MKNPISYIFDALRLCGAILFLAFLCAIGYACFSFFYAIASHGGLSTTQSVLFGIGGLAIFLIGAFHVFSEDGTSENNDAEGRRRKEERRRREAESAAWRVNQQYRQQHGHDRGIRL